jgi:hypothetical protein
MRNLNLKKETLAELSTEELADLVGASFRTKYECTESYQICNPLSVDLCLEMQRPTRSCIPTQTC